MPCERSSLASRTAFPFLLFLFSVNPDTNTNKFIRDSTENEKKKRPLRVHSHSVDHQFFLLCFPLDGPLCECREAVNV